jgi:NTP pyrophosphatase (non-canonical NTP hydrolase)
MKLSEYQKLARRTEKPLPLEAALQHGILGILTEAGELADPIKKAVIYGSAMNNENIREEIGDLLWYIAVVANNLGIDLDSVAYENIAKLQARYPEKYTDQDAIERKDKV